MEINKPWITTRRRITNLEYKRSVPKHNIRLVSHDRQNPRSNISKHMTWSVRSVGIKRTKVCFRALSLVLGHVLSPVRFLPRHSLLLIANYTVCQLREFGFQQFLERLVSFILMTTCSKSETFRRKKGSFVLSTMWLICLVLV
jgi:hypothetical protein